MWSTSGRRIPRARSPTWKLSSTAPRHGHCCKAERGGASTECLLLTQGSPLVHFAAERLPLLHIDGQKRVSEPPPLNPPSTGAVHRAATLERRTLSRDSV